MRDSRAGSTGGCALVLPFWPLVFGSSTEALLSRRIRDE